MAVQCFQAMLFKRQQRQTMRMLSPVGGWSCAAACIWLIVSGGSLQAAPPLAHYDFSQGLEGWTPNAMVSSTKVTPAGLVMRVQTPDPFLVSPPLDFPAKHFITVTIRLRTTGEPLAQFYFGAAFSETNSLNFVVKNDGLWHDYQVRIPPMGPGCRLRFDPPCGDGEVGLAWIRVETSPVAPVDPWATSAELRGKKAICAGQFATSGGASSVTSRYLANHPEFTASFPYDGYVVPAVIDGASAKKMGLEAREYFVHELVWNSVAITPEGIATALSDLKKTKWRGLTDNFLNYTMIDGSRGRFTPDLTSDKDWAILENNARMAARLCREGNLKGFWLDTEQYGNYRWRTETGVPEFDPKRPINLKFPLGKDTPAVLRRRGAQWIKAVQAELPAVKIMITFAWSPDTHGYGPLQGADGFLDGVLDAIKAPGQLIHGYENTFYFGQGPGTTHTANGFPGDRARYETARAQMRQWRSFSGNPKKYDEFLKVGMAAWVEDDPWNLYDGWPSGEKASFWSNIALALASTDEYVWVWSEHTHYAKDAPGPVNPFLSSLRNRTFNQGNEETATLAEDFATDPMQRGWFFDFDMLNIAGKKKPSHAVPLMSIETQPYVWDKNAGALQVRGEPPTSQRRRFAHPIQPVSRESGFRVAMDFMVEDFGADRQNPMVLGFFTSDKTVGTDSFTLRVAGPESLTMVLDEAGISKSFPMAVPTGLKAGKTYRLTLEQGQGQGSCLATLSEEGAQLASAPIALMGRKGAFGWDELGISLWEGAPAGPAGDKNPYRYQVRKVVLDR